MRAAFIPIIALLGAGCSPWDGTWLFSFDLDTVSTTGDCTYTTGVGIERSWVDIYTSGGGSVVVMFEPILEGVAEGRDLTASGATSYASSSYEYSEGTDLVVTREGASLSGTLSSWLESTGAASYSCEVQYALTAERVASNPDRYLQD